MIREGILWISESLFYIQGGVMLASTPWLMFWIIFWCLVMASPMIYWSHSNQTKWAPLGFIVLFFPILFITIGPPIFQQQMMQECRDQTATVNFIVDGEQTDQTEIVLTQCRYKENYYGEFGEWQIENIGGHGW